MQCQFSANCKKKAIVKITCDSEHIVWLCKNHYKSADTSVVEMDGDSESETSEGCSHTLVIGGGCGSKIESVEWVFEEDDSPSPGEDDAEEVATAYKILVLTLRRNLPVTSGQLQQQELEEEVLKLYGDLSKNLFRWIYRARETYCILLNSVAEDYRDFTFLAPLQELLAALNRLEPSRSLKQLCRLLEGDCLYLNYILQESDAEEDFSESSYSEDEENEEDEEDEEKEAVLSGIYFGR